ncbi:MAG: O-antigen ligase family protein [Sphingobacteriales bacterium]|nr:O-antigen ligase family protein [Sphingobacteriales bacterium]
MKVPAITSPAYRPLLLVALLLTGLFFSRALLSLLVGLSVLLLLIPSVRKEFTAVFKKPLLFLVTGIPVFYLYLFFIDPDSYTLERLLFYLSIVGMLCLAHYMAATTELLLPFLLSLAVLSTLPTLADMLLNTGLAPLYGKGQVAYILMKGDHQRFSIWISGCLGLSWYLFVLEKKKWASVFILFFSLFLIVLAVRTGWLFILLVTLAGGLMYLRRKRSRRLWWSSLLAVLLLGGLAMSIPFVRNKIRYVQWEWSERREAEKLGASDAVRRMVNETAWTLITDHPAGLGSRKAEKRLKEEVDKAYPQSHINYEWPFNQYLYWWLTAGWILGSLPIVLLLFLLYRLYFTRNYFTAVWVIFMAMTCIYESTLEMQYGLFLAVFFTVLMYLYESGLRMRGMVKNGSTPAT